MYTFKYLLAPTYTCETCKKENDLGLCQMNDGPWQCNVCHCEMMDKMFGTAEKDFDRAMGVI